MRVFEGTPKDTWGEKVNFIDDNNVFVGYDMGQCCCEHAEWFIAESVLTKMPTLRCNKDEVEGYNFDIEYFQESKVLDYEDMDGFAPDSGGVAIFKLVKDASPDLYLHLFNCHNGYYGHGFTMKIGDEVKREGCL